MIEKIGWEFETIESSLPKNTRKFYYSKKTDASVAGDGLEFISTPLSLEDSIYSLYNFLRSARPDTDKSCGFHVHVSLDTFSKSLEKNRIANNLYFLAKEFETRLLECVPPSRQANTYCRKLTYMFSDNQNSLRKKMGTIVSEKYRNSKRYCWLNFVELFRRGGIGTIEFRLAGNSSRFFYLSGLIVVYYLLIMGAHELTINNPSRWKRIMEKISLNIERLKNLYERNGDPRETLASIVFDATFDKKRDILTNFVKKAVY